MMDTRPTLTDRVRFKMKHLASQTTAAAAQTAKGRKGRPKVILRRHSTLRRSTRSINRSGYAFSHQEGFGRLITTGTNMIASIASGARIAKRTPAALSIPTFGSSRTGRITNSAGDGAHHPDSVAGGISDNDSAIVDGRFRLKPGVSPVSLRSNKRVSSTPSLKSSNAAMLRTHQNVDV